MAPNSTAGDQAAVAFVDRSPFAAGMSHAAQGGFMGLVVSAVQNSLQKHNHGALGIFTRTGAMIPYLAALIGTFGFTEAAVANSRRKNDALNSAAGGCAGGLIVGAYTRSFPMMAGACAGMATLMGTFQAAGASLTGAYARPSPRDAKLGADAHEDGWREERAERRKRFFKQPQPETESE